MPSDDQPKERRSALEAIVAFNATNSKFCAFAAKLLSQLPDRERRALRREALAYAREQLGPVFRRLALEAEAARLEWRLWEARCRLDRYWKEVDLDSQEWRAHCAEAWRRRDAVWVAVDELMHFPAPSLDQVSEKRKTAGIWLGIYPRWQELIAADVERLDLVRA